jgi:hypothetical protein
VECSCSAGYIGPMCEFESNTFQLNDYYGKFNSLFLAKNISRIRYPLDNTETDSLLDFYDLTKHNRSSVTSAMADEVTGLISKLVLIFSK